MTLEENVTDQEWEEANERGREMLRTLPRATAACFDPQSRRIQIDINWGFSISFAPERVQDLHKASDDQLSSIEVSYPGFSFYFPKLDVDLWVPNLVKGRFGDDAWEEEWAAFREPPVAA